MIFARRLRPMWRYFHNQMWQKNCQLVPIVPIWRKSRSKRCSVKCSKILGLTFVGEWLSLVEHLVRDQGVGGSNPLSPTNFLLINNLQGIKSGMTPRASARESDFVKSRSHLIKELRI